MEIKTLYSNLGIPVASAWVLKKLCGPALDVAGELAADLEAALEQFAAIEEDLKR